VAYAWKNIYTAASSGSGTDISVSATYAAHDRAQVFVTYGNGSSVTEAISDGTNTYTKRGSTVNDPDNGQSGAWFECVDCAAGTFTVNFNLASSEAFRGIAVMAQSGLDNSPAAQIDGHNQLFFTTDITSGTVTPASQPGMFAALAFDDGGGQSSCVAGAGFTDEGVLTNFDSAFGTVSRVEDQRLTSTSGVVAHFTASTGGYFFIFAWFIPEGAGGGAGGMSARAPIMTTFGRGRP